MSQPSQSTGEIHHDPLDPSPAGGGVPNNDTTGSKPSSRKPSIISKSSQTVPPIINNRSSMATNVPAMQTHEMVPLPSNLQSSIPLSKANPSVKFDDDGAQERSRRFTISSQPSAVNLTGQPQPQPQQQIHQPGVSRNASLLKQLKDSVDGLSFLPNIQTKIQSNKSSANSSRVHSPDIVSPRLNISPFDGKQKRMKSPTPPPAAEERLSPHQAAASNQLPLSSNESSRRNSKTDPINISRKNSAKKIPKKILVASPVGPPVPFQQFLTFEDDGKFHILLACTGSVATIKVPMIIDKLFQIYGTNKISIQLVVTKAATHFLKGTKIHNDVKIWRDEDEWANYEYSTTETTACKKPKNPFDKMILHNELRRWADIMLISPLSANTLAKIANGISDNLLTNIIRAWGPQQSNIKKPILAAPAMNTFMYTHPITAKQLAILSSPDWFGIEILKPVEKVLVCGDIGMGGMREWSDIVDILRRRISGLKAERAKLDGDDDIEEAEEEHDDEENQDDGDDGDNDDDDDDEDDDDDDEDDEEEDGDENDEHLDTNDGEEEDDDDSHNAKSHKQGPNHDANDTEDDLIFELTDQDCEDGKQIEQKLPIPKETQNII